jgi:DNA-3-methyladenine glycosylase II
VTKRYWRPRRAVRALSERDPRFAALVAQVGHPSVELRDSTFEAIARAITYQQLAGAAAGAIWGRVLALFPDGGEVDPAVFLRKRDATYRKAGLSGAKTRSIKDLARHVTRGDFDPSDFTDQSNEDITQALTQVWGIGQGRRHASRAAAHGELGKQPEDTAGVDEKRARAKPVRVVQ